MQRAKITKGIRSGKTAAYFYGEGCRKVLEAIDAAPQSTQNPCGLRHIGKEYKMWLICALTASHVLRLYRIITNIARNVRKDVERLCVRS